MPFSAGKFTFGEAAKKFREQDLALIDSAVAVIRKTVKLHGPRLIQAEIQAVTPRIPVDRGTYRRSFRAEDIPWGAILYNFSPHGPIIEFGRRPGARMPPLAAILDWVRRKKIGAKIYGPVQEQYGPRQKGGKNRSDRSRAVENQQHWIALQIARKIKARGLPAHYVLRKASEKLEKKLDEDLARKLGESGESAHGDPHT